MNKKVYCYFHNDDPDGWSSSAVVKMKYPNAEFYGYNYEKKLDLVKGYDIVYMVDISSTNKDMKYLMENNKKFVWIDHHAKKIWDAYKELGKEIDGLRDAESKHSACVLTWKYLFPDKDVPELLKYIEDIDIWKWKLSYTDEINIALFIEYMEDRDQLIFIMKHWECTRDQLLDNGVTYIKMRKHEVQSSIKIMKEINWNNYKIAIVNSHLHGSFIGHEILDTRKDIDFVVIWYIYNDVVKCSLRSRGNVDVAEIASKYGGGGGHKPAAGLTVTLKDFVNIFHLN